MIKPGPILDRDGRNGSCKACWKHYESLVGELDNIRIHGSVRKRLLKSRFKNNPTREGQGQNYKGRRQWLWNHTLTSHGEYIGHAACIALITDTHPQTLTSLRSSFMDSRGAQRAYPATKVLNTTELLEQLLYPTPNEPEGWDTLNTRRAWLSEQIELHGSRVEVFLPPDSASPPIHKNAFVKTRQLKVEFELFKKFVLHNSIPSGRMRRGKTHFLLPTIRRIKFPRKPSEGANQSRAAKYTHMKNDSLSYKFLESLKDLDGQYTEPSDETVRLWFQELFPRYAVCPVQSDYCDTCAELKRQRDSAKKSMQLMKDDSNIGEDPIRRKDVLAKSYDAALSAHRRLAAAEQKEYKTRTSNSSAFFQNLTEAEINMVHSWEEQEAVVACDFQMGKLVPHWGESAQPGKTYYSQKLMHHIFGVVNSSLDPDKIYVIDETAAGEKDSDLVCSFLHNYVQNCVRKEFKKIRIYLDSAPYFKSKYIIWWAAEMICQGRFDRVILSFMVPGHTKFGPDLLFAIIAHAFYKTDVFNSNDLLEVIRSCEVQASLTTPAEVHRWKALLGQKYKNISDITQYNYMVIEKKVSVNSQGHQVRGVTLKVKRSVTEDSFASVFQGGNDSLDLLLPSAGFSQSAVPTHVQSAAVDSTMNKPLQGPKLKNMADIYQSFIEESRWPFQLKAALTALENSESEMEDECQRDSPRNTQYDEKAVNLGEELGTEDGPAIVHSYLTRTAGSSTIPDHTLLLRLQNIPDLGIRTMPRRKKARNA